VARDGRLSGPELIEALIKGLRASGRDVIDIGMVPTPVLYFATHHLETQSGVMLTGSHNGPEYNGLKIVLDGETLSGDAITKIRDRITNNELSEGQGSLQTTDIGADYLRRITEDVPVALGGAFKIIVDCGNGVAGQLAPQLYRAMGHDVVELFCDIDGKFPNHQPDPSQPENLQTLIEIVKEESADLGFAFDGDGDRLGIVDGAGKIIWPDRQMMLFARDVLSRNQGASIIFDVKCSRYLKEVIEASGGKPLMWKTGHSLIKSKMKEIDAPLGGELSGHIFFKERWYGFDDALYAGARVLEILTNSKGSPTETFAELPEGISTPELRIPLAEKNHAKAMAIMKKKMTFEDAEVTDIDGLRVDFSGGWGLVRPSNTSPFLVARLEDERLAAIEQEKEAIKAHAVAQDKILLDTYSNTDDIQMTSDGKISALDSTIKLANKRSEKFQSDLDKLTATAAAEELAGKQPSEDLLKDIDSLNRQIKNNNKYIADKRMEQEEIKKEYAEKIERFLQLTDKGK